MPVEREALFQRLRTAEGHLHAVCQMLKDDLPCQQVLHQLNAVQCALDAAGSKILLVEVERRLWAVRKEPCPERRCEELAHLADLYPFVNKFTVKFYGAESR